ncbi:hypothetical protein AHF37_07753, partial [Paragonimus kellicotti]
DNAGHTTPSLENHYIYTYTYIHYESILFNINVSNRTERYLLYSSIVYKKGASQLSAPSVNSTLIAAGHFHLLSFQSAKHPRTQIESDYLT